MGVDDGCGTSLNHAVVVVGYTDSSEYDDGDQDDNDNDNDDTDNDDTDNDDTDDGSDDGGVASCEVTKWWHTCESTAARRRMTDEYGYDKYFKIQNSWGTGWGDRGYILLEMADSGTGTCGMYSVVQYVDGCRADEC